MKSDGIHASAYAATERWSTGQRFSEADPAADDRLRAAAGEGRIADRPPLLVALAHRRGLPSRPLHQRDRLRLVDGHCAGHRDVGELDARDAHRERSHRQGEKAVALQKPPGDERDPPAGALDGRLHDDVALRGRGQVMDRERARGAGDVVDRHRQPAQNDRGDVATVRPALDPPSGVHAAGEPAVAQRLQRRVAVEAGQPGHGGRHYEASILFRP